MLTKRKLLRMIDELKINYSNITNFDELYKKIMDSYQDSRALINEQILQYDKKIIQNNATIDARLEDFRDKIDKAIEASFDRNKKWLDEQKDIFERISQEYTEKLVQISKELHESTDQKIYK